MPRWLIDVLDRELPDLVGARRDAIAQQILDALPLEKLNAAIKEAAATQLRAWCVSSDVSPMAHDISANASMAALSALGSEE